MWVSFAIGSVGYLGLVWCLAFGIEAKRVREILSYLLPAVAIATCFACTHQWNAFARLAASSLVLLYVFKGAALLRRPQNTIRSMDRLGLLAFSFAWPGIDSSPFDLRRQPAIEDQKRFAGGTTRFLLGIAALLLVSLFYDRLPSVAAEWLGILALLTAFHLGFTDMLTEAIHAVGWKVQPLFDAPYRSQSLSEFWSKRWNRPFVELDRIFFLPLLTKKFGIRIAVVGVFVISGLLHELALSFPAQSGWGGPVLYFLFQGLMVLSERKLSIRGPIWVALIVLAPVPILFHSGFRQELIRPLLVWAHDTLHSVGIEGMFRILVPLLGFAQFCVLFASSQVPKQLRWNEELPRLSSLNHKLMWTYGSFIVYTIVSFGVSTLLLQSDILAGTRAGLVLSTMTFLFWGLRLVTDAFYFKKSDWPQGPFMQIGHTMLNCLFTGIFLGYGSVIGWHLLAR